jgi:zinc/manganese transport system substrate-binding protein
MRIRNTLLALALGTSTLAMADTALAADKVKVVASFSILGDMVREIGGGHVELTTLVGPDGDAHVYEPTPSDARLVETAEFKGTEVVATAGIAPIPFGAEEHADHAAGENEHKHEAGEAGHEDHAHEAAGGDHADHDHGSNDPHAWQDLSNGLVYAENIVKGLSAVDPENAADYRAKGDAFVAEIKAMDAEVKAELATVPEAQRRVVTSHDAFGYFARAYKIDFIAPEGVSTDAEASASDVAKIIDQIRHEKISAVFVENVSDPRLIERISSETDAKIGGTLYSDALSGPEGPAGTYLKMFKNNIEQIIKALKTS